MELAVPARVPPNECLGIARSSQKALATLREAAGEQSAAKQAAEAMVKEAVEVVAVRVEPKAEVVKAAAKPELRMLFVLCRRNVKLRRNGSATISKA